MYVHIYKFKNRMETRGIEPPTYCMRSSRSAPELRPLSLPLLHIPQSTDYAGWGLTSIDRLSTHSSMIKKKFKSEGKVRSRHHNTFTRDSNYLEGYIFIQGIRIFKREKSFKGTRGPRLF